MFTRRNGLMWALLALFVVAGCGGGSSGGGNGVQPDALLPTFDPADFDSASANVDNPFSPLFPGTSWRYEGENEDGELEVTEVAVSHRTRIVAGVECVIVVDRVFADGELIEETFDWYAQDADGNVWYFGEESAEYEDGEIIGTPGSWEAGVDGALPGILMWADPAPGGPYYQEFYEGEAEDQAQVVALDVPVTLSDGSVLSCLQTKEWNPLDPDSDEYKYYAVGIGGVREETIDGAEQFDLVEMADQRFPDIDPAEFPASTTIDHPFLPLLVGSTWTYELDLGDEVETILVEVTGEIRVVMGIPCVVVRDRVWEDGLLVEDTRDWFAQDVHGNVWYFGEDVDNYEYDDEDNLIGTDHEGAWEAGVDGAMPGILMPAVLRIGDSYRQEYAEGEAEDLAAIVGLDVPVTLADGSQHVCLKTLEWNPLEEDSAEYKYWAPGIGLVREETIDGEEQVDLTDHTTD